MSGMELRGASLVALTLLAAACSGSPGPSPSGPTATSTPSTSSPTTGSQALITSLPAGCKAARGSDREPVENGQWVGKQDVLRLLPAPNGEAMALDAGKGCADRQAIVSELDGTAGQPLIPTATGPTSAIGWLDEATLLVSEGGCAGPMKLWRVELGNGGTTRLVFNGANRASVRISDPTPPPPLPKIGVNAGLA